MEEELGPFISVPAKRLLECHAALIDEDLSEAYNAIYWAMQEMPDADPYKPFAHVEKLFEGDEGLTDRQED